jgi:hypothetical protein
MPIAMDEAGWADWTRMSQTTALFLVLALYVAPLLHVLMSPAAGPFRPPPGSRCPIGPRFGWLVMVLLLGPIGWVMFMTRRRPR